jgi:hypothetical protein
MNNLSVKFFTVAVLLCGAIFLASCSSTTTTTTNSNTAVVKPANSANTAKTDAPKTDAPKTETTSGDSVGVAECDEYVKKYEACLTKIAEKAPQAQPGLKTAFEQQRNGLKQAASTEQGKTMMATQCKQFIESAKQSTAAYGCAW